MPIASSPVASPHGADLHGTNRHVEDAGGLGRVPSPLHLGELNLGLVSPFIFAPLLFYMPELAFWLFRGPNEGPWED